MVNILDLCAIPCNSRDFFPSEDTFNNLFNRVYTYCSREQMMHWGGRGLCHHFILKLYKIISSASKRLTDNCSKLNIMLNEPCAQDCKNSGVIQVIDNAKQELLSTVASNCSSELVEKIGDDLCNSSISVYKNFLSELFKSFYANCPDSFSHRVADNSSVLDAANDTTLIASELFSDLPAQRMGNTELFFLLGALLMGVLILALLARNSAQCHAQPNTSFLIRARGHYNEIEREEVPMHTICPSR